MVTNKSSFIQDSKNMVNSDFNGATTNENQLFNIDSSIYSGSSHSEKSTGSKILLFKDNSSLEDNSSTNTLSSNTTDSELTSEDINFNEFFPKTDEKQRERELIEKERGKLLEKEFSEGLTKREQKRMDALIWQINILEQEDTKRIINNYKKIKDEKMKYAKDLNLFLKKLANLKYNPSK